MKATFDKKDTIAICESNDFDARIVKFAKSGCGMSESWWRKTHRMNEDGELLGVYKTSSGKLRRITLWG